MATQRAVRRSHLWLTVLPFALFILLSTAFFWNALGDDLASSYVGCRVLATGHAASLYSYDPLNFAGIADTDTAWPQQAAAGDYHGYLHPYVQTPLWAWGLEPLCVHLQFPAFKHLFLVFSLLSLAGCVYLTARFWAPRLLHPVALTLVLAALACSEPFVFAMHLVQTHALLLLLTVAGLVLAEQEHPVAAGLCVACAAAIKITPGVLLVYWLVARRWRAAGSFVVWSVLLLGVTRLTAGSSLFHDFLTDMHRVSNILLVAENNQSLASWYMARFFSPDEVFDVNAYPLPTALRYVSLTLLVTCAAVGGLLDRKGRRPALQVQSTHTPLGAGIALIAMTLFGPIAWTHYSIVLVIPLMLLVQTALGITSSRIRVLIGASVAATIALVYRPLAPDVVNMDLGDYAVLHGAFYAGALTLLTLAAVGYLHRTASPEAASSTARS